MQKKVIVPVSIAAVGFIAGGIMLGSLGASAHGEHNFEKRGDKGELVAEVLSVEVEELRELKESSDSFEDFILSNGFDSVEDFQSAMDEALTEKLTEEGLTQEEIDEKLAAVAERREFRESMEAITEDLLGLSREELRAAKEDGQTMDDLVQAAGYDSIQDYKAAVDEALDEAGIERPDRPFKKAWHKAKHRGF